MEYISPAEYAYANAHEARMKAESSDRRIRVLENTVTELVEAVNVLIIAVKDLQDEK